MALQGTLETFSVPEVLRLLAGTRKTGMLALDGDRGSGQVWLVEGRIVGARSAHEPEGDVEPVLFDLLRFSEGSFVFETDAGYPGHDPVDADVETALETAEALLEEWQEIAAVVPSLRVWVSMVPALPASSVTVTAEQWAALAIVGRGTSGHRLADELGLGELDGSRRIRDLAAAGFVEVDDTPVTTEVADDQPVDDLGDDGVWTTTDDLTVGLAGFVARAADEERSERSPDLGSFDVSPEPDVADLTGPDEPAVDIEPEPVAEVDDDVFVEVIDDDDVTDDEVTGDLDEATDRDEPTASVVDDGDPDEFLSQLANLSPKAAAAIEATASEGETSARRLPSGDGDEEINRNLLLKFLSSAKP